MAQATKDEQRRERLREYDAALVAARSPVAVLGLFAKGREARSAGEPLEEEFAATAVDGVDPADLLPASVWVALRQGDVEATIELLMRMSRTEFVLASHEEVDAGYRLTKVEERRALPDVELLVAQLAAFLRVPVDVVAIIAGWGADDPRTAAEIETLLEQRFGAAASIQRRPAAVPESRRGASGGGLSMSAAEFTALLNLTPEQGAVLDTLVRQATITIAADG